jgi:hypothetical protein
MRYVNGLKRLEKGSVSVEDTEVKKPCGRHGLE